MLDLSKTKSAPNWSTVVEVGDVVLYRFPTPGEPWPVPPARCLVLDVDHVGGDIRLTLSRAEPLSSPIYPTTQIALRARHELNAADLNEPSTFDADRALFPAQTSWLRRRSMGSWSGSARPSELKDHLYRS